MKGKADKCLIPKTRFIHEERLVTIVAALIIAIGMLSIVAIAPVQENINIMLSTGANSIGMALVGSLMGKKLGNKEVKQ